MNVYVGLSVFLPIMVMAIVGVIVYIRISTRKLYDEMRRRGLLLQAFPVIVPYNVLDEEIRSPITGLPPPPPYDAMTATPPYKQQP